MASPYPQSEPSDSTPTSEGDLAVFPPMAPAQPADPDRARSFCARPIVPLAVAFGLGIALAPALPLGSVGWAAAALVGLFLGAIGPWAGARHLRWPGLVAGFLCLGAQAMVVALREAPPHHLSRLPEAALGAPIPLEGWVAVPPDPQPAELRDAGDALRTRFVVEVTHLTLGDRRVSATGRARLTVLGPALDLRYGDEVRGHFRLRHPRRFDNPGAFDYPAYLASQGIFLEGWTQEPVEALATPHGSRILAAVFRVRALLLQRIDAAMPAAEAGLLKATVLGDRSGLTPEMNRAFLDSGTFHILAISGLNVSLLAGGLFAMLRLARASPRLAACASAILVTFYAALAGASASVIRAAVMADVYLLAIVLDRRADLLNSLALSALAILWWNPRFLQDVGFQLTFLATLGIILVVPRCERGLASVWRPLRWVIESVAITVAATAITLPILATTFNRVSPAGLLANIPIVPLSGLITGLGTAACALFLLIPAGVTGLNQVNGWLVDLLFGLARWFADWPWSSVRVFTPTGAMLVTYYAAVAMLLWAFPVVPAMGGRGRSRRWAAWGAVACCLGLGGEALWLLYPPEKGAAVRVTFLDVGQGEAIFLEAPGQGRMLVDAGGTQGGGFDIGQHVIVPFLWHEWVRHLDVLALTHPQSDHIGGAPTILRMVSVGEVWTGAGPALSPTDLWIQEYLRRRRIPHRVVVAGDAPFRMGEAVIEALHPDAGSMAATGGAGRAPRPNDRSLVLRVRLEDQAVLLTGDLERDGEAALLHSGVALGAQVIKVPHHGSRQSSTEAFLRAVGAQTAVLSVGHRNPFRHPHPEILARYHALGIRLWRTDRNGAVGVEMRPGNTRVWGRRGESHEPRAESRDVTIGSPGEAP